MDPSKKAWERMTLDEVRRLLASNHEDGLSQQEVVRRRELYGENILEHVGEIGVFGKIVAQFKSPLTLILLAAGIATLVLGEHVDTIVIFIALTINVVIGVLQEERASKAFEKLNASQERHALIVREGKRLNVPTEDLVPGDLVLLQGGYFVPADIRLVEEKDLKINEAALTGEWLPVSKSNITIQEKVPVAERENMAWMGTLIEAGYGKGVVVATGSRTQVGEIALALGTTEAQVTPLQKNIRHIARFLSYVVGVALVAILVLGLSRGEPLADLLLIAIAIAVATIPSGLPAAVTVVLAIGMEAILKRGGLVRNLLAAETLGATTVILTDKTGTLTEAHMKLASLHSYQGIRDHREEPADDNRFLLQTAVMGCEAFIEEAEDAPSKLTVHGHPTEKAMVIAGLEAGLSQDELLKEYKRLDLLQFTSKRRFSAALIEKPKLKSNRLTFNGEPEKLLEAATYIHLENKKQKLTPHEKRRFAEILAEKTSEGKRLIAVAYKDVQLDIIPENQKEVTKLLQSIVFVGFLALEDPVRENVADAIEEVRGAGAHVMMLTGDNPETAHYIAQKVGITKPGDELVIRGSEIDQWDDAELLTRLQQIRVIARAIPAHKLRIARVLRHNGEVVAMTGDGINDAPALRAASIGIAVGAGTEVAKEASDLVLINNSFSIVVAAIEEGRRIIDNLKKIVAYLLSTSFSEIFVIGGALIGGVPLPLLPAQILWANIVEEGLMSFSFAFEGRDPHAMKRDPRSSRSKNILTPELKKLIVIVSTVTGAMLIALYYWLLSLEPTTDEYLAEIRTVMFVALSLDAIFFTFSLKSLDTPVWKINIFSNKYLLVALLMSIALLFAALVFDPLSNLLSLVPLTPSEKLLLLGIGLLNLLLIEFVKYLFFEKNLTKQEH